MRIREYAGPFTVLATGMLGFSLFCIVSAAALSDPGGPNTSSIGPQNVVDSAISNINTVAALTVQSVSDYVGTSTVSPTPTDEPTQTEAPTSTATLMPTRTRMPPTRTPTRDISKPFHTATRRPAPIRTKTPVPPTFTQVPDTNTPVPPPTDPPPTVPPTDPPPPTVPPTDPPPPTVPPTNEPDPTATEAPVAP